MLDHISVVSSTSSWSLLLSPWSAGAVLNCNRLTSFVSCVDDDESAATAVLNC